MANVWTTGAFILCILLLAVRSQTNICYEKADILFILDASSSAGASEFQKQLQFAATFVNNFQVGLAQFSVITIGNNASLVFDFDDYKDNNAVKNAILKIDYTQGVTDTGAALKLAREQAFTTTRGARRGVPKIVIVSTERQSNYPIETALEAAKLKNSKVLVLSIGVGRSFNQTELEVIATQPQDVFQVVDYRQLLWFVYDYSQMICQKVQDFTCSNQADIFFLLDSSSNITQDFYKSELNFTYALSLKFLALKETRIGAATFGGNVLQTVITLGQFTTQLPLSQVLQAATYLGGTTDTDSALESVISQKLFDPASGDRPYAVKILIILTDGWSVSAAQAKQTAYQLRMTGVSIIAIGVSNPNIHELQDLVSHSVLDVVTNLANPLVAFDRIQTLLSLDVCLPNICYEKADILFILDASGSVGTLDFQKQLQFAATFINNFQVGLAQFSVITISSNASLVFDFDDYTDNNAVKNAIRNIYSDGGGRNTAAALKLAREQAFTPSRGARTGVPRIVIVSTDGWSNDPHETAVEAMNLKNTNVLVMSIGVGRSYIKTEMDIIATHSEDVFEVVDYSQLVSIVYDYSEMICQEVQLFTCSSQADILFLFDSSSTIPQDIYKNELNFAIALSSKFNLTETHIGAAIFGGKILHTVITLGEFTSQFPMFQFIQSAIYLGGTTDTDSALESVISQKLFDPASGSRPYAAKILIILTDGGSVSAAQAKLTATQLRVTGVSIIAIGVSNPNIPELKDLVSDSLLDVVTNLDNPLVAFDRIQTLSPNKVCFPPATAFRGPCITEILDILLILDSSDNVSRTEFHQQLADAANLAENFYLGADAIQFGALSFGTVPRSLFNFNDFTEYKPLQQAILNAYYQGGSSNTFLALEAALNIFTSGNGSRVTASKLAVVFTDGRSTDSGLTQEYAAALKNAGVHIISVGLSNPDLQELEAIASSPSEVFVNDFTGLVHTVMTYNNRLCGTEFICKGIQFADVIFLVDSSSSMSNQDYKAQLNFVVDVTSKFTLGPHDIRFGAVIFSNDPVKLFDLKEFDSMSTLNTAILSAAHLNGGTDTAKAINFVREQQMFSVAAGARYTAIKILIILTDSSTNSFNETVAAALRLKYLGVKIIAVGIGSEGYDEELRQLASDEQSVFLVPEFLTTIRIQEDVARKVCDLPKDDVNEVTTLCETFDLIDGIYPNPQNCAGFVECTAHLTQTLQCPEGLHFNTANRVCDDVNVVDCQVNYHYFDSP